MVTFKHRVELDRFSARRVSGGYQQKRERRWLAYVANALFGRVMLLKTHSKITLWDEDYDYVWHFEAASTEELDQWLTHGRQQALADLNAAGGVTPELRMSWLKVGWEGVGITSSWVRQLVDVAVRLENEGPGLLTESRDRQDKSGDGEGKTENRRYLPRSGSS